MDGIGAGGSNKAASERTGSLLTLTAAPVMGVSVEEELLVIVDASGWADMMMEVAEVDGEGIGRIRPVNSAGRLSEVEL